MSTSDVEEEDGEFVDLIGAWNEKPLELVETSTTSSLRFIHNKYESCNVFIFSPF